MTIDEAIRRADEAKPNAVPRTNKVRWLNNVDETITRKLIRTHAFGKDLQFDGYDDETEGTTLLLAPAPWDEMYVYYLMAQIDLWNNELDRYQNSALLYNQTYAEYANYYNRTIPPRRGPHLHFGGGKGPCCPA